MWAKKRIFIISAHEKEKFKILKNYDYRYRNNLTKKDNLNKYIRKAHNGIVHIIYRAESELDELKFDVQKKERIQKELMQLHQIRQMIFKLTACEVSS